MENLVKQGTILYQINVSFIVYSRTFKYNFSPRIISTCMCMYIAISVYVYICVHIYEYVYVYISI